METTVQSSGYALLDQVPLGICVVSAALTVQFWNACLESWTGISRHDILGSDLTERFPHLGEPMYRQRLQMIFEGGPPTVFSSQLHRHLIPAPLPDGQLRIQHTVVTAIASEDGSSDALLSLQDVTDATRRLEDHRALHHQALLEIRERQKAEKKRRHLEAKIQYAQKLESLAVLAGGIAHDFNNILVGILGNADLALLKESELSPRRKYLESIIASAQRAADLSNQMLAFSGKGKFVTKVVDIAAMARDAARLLEVSLPSQSRFRFDLPEEALPVEADSTQIRQVLINLITNASDAIGGAGGEITIAGGTRACDAAYLSESHLMSDLPAGDYVYLDVADDGPGMPRETLDKIFDPFFSTKFTGRGLGLAAVLGIVQGHRGTIRVDSTPGEGTTFRVLLPRTERLNVERASKPPGVTTQAPLETDCDGTVLVIDDEDVVRTVAQRTLEDCGYTVLTTSDGESGVRTFVDLADRISLVILDMTMPRISGIETLKLLRQADPDITVILSSGYSEQVARNHFAGQPISGFLPKPYKPSELLVKVREILGRV